MCKCVLEMLRKEKRIALFCDSFGFLFEQDIQSIGFCIMSVIVTTVQNSWMDMKPRNTFPQIGCCDRYEPEHVQQQKLKVVHGHPYTC